MRCPHDGEEGAVPADQTPRDQKMHVGMPIQEIANALQARDGARDRRVRPRCGLEQLPEHLVGQASESGQSLPVAEEGPQAPREREDHVAVRGLGSLPWESRRRLPAASHGRRGTGSAGCTRTRAGTRADNWGIGHARRHGPEPHSAERSPGRGG